MDNQEVNGKSVLIIGSGPIVIGQACEFDYSGTQACRALKQEGYRVILINSNPATIMTDCNIADATYIEPITTYFLEKIIAKEKPNFLLPTVGGQTALNISIELYKKGILDKYGVNIIGAHPDVIDKAENRKRFNKAMSEIGLETPRNCVVSSIEEAIAALADIGLPAIIRPSFTLGGSGSGIAYTKEQYIKIVKYGLDISPTHQVLVDECLIGWKEYEMEVIRDKKDNAIIVCAIENIDPMGVHTGDSITVTPVLTLTDKEYQQMRNASIAVLKKIGVETGGANVQFAVNPVNGRMVVVEMNPRVSRSSALASKATGFPIAKVAAKLAVGYTLDQIQNDITKFIPASFEPTIDYIVIKIPRFAFENFNIPEEELSTSMKSVGEIMAIGRNFPESLQKGLRSIEMGFCGLEEPKINTIKQDMSLLEKVSIIKTLLTKKYSNTILLIGQALRYNISSDEIANITKYDKWFIDQIKRIIDAEKLLLTEGLPQDKDGLLMFKKLGFSDAQLANLTGIQEDEIFTLRHGLGVVPVFKSVDTCAGEFAAQTSYLYSCYESYRGNSNTAICESNPSDRRKVIILGSGPNRIGQGIEFDYACVHAAFSLKEENVEAIMINCNPETVSTDYDISDKLYFEPLYHEDVIEIILNEQSKGNLLGVIVQFGGQTPLKLSKILQKHNIKIIGTDVDKIDLAENRDRFRKLLSNLNLKQPNNTISYKIEDIETGIDEIDYPVILRPSNVLGGRAMAILYNKKDLISYLSHNKSFLINDPILIDKFLNNVTEIDVDALSDGEDIFIAGILEHIEEAGIHSGDSACSIPTRNVSKEMIYIIKECTVKLAKALNIIGLINVQYAIHNNELYIIEVNPRASRTVPYVDKSTGNNIVKIATKLMLGRKLKEFKLKTTAQYYTVKEAVFPFARFDKVDTLLGPEMKSTGEVMGIDKNIYLAFLKAQIAAGNYYLNSHKNRPISVLFRVDDKDKLSSLALAQKLVTLGYGIVVTSSIYSFFAQNDFTQNIIQIDKEIEDKTDSIIKCIEKKEIDLAILTAIDSSVSKKEFNIRIAIFMNRIPYCTTMKAAHMLVGGIAKLLEENSLSVFSLQDLHLRNNFPQFKSKL